MSAKDTGLVPNGLKRDNRRPKREAAIAPRFILIALALWLCSAAGAAELHGKVVAVGDGDTLTVLDSTRTLHKVRLSGIDAPERRQPYGQQAKQHLAALAHGKEVRVVWDKRDRFGRLVGHVLLRECERPGCAFRVDVGLEQIKAGLAWHYRKYAREQPPGERWRYALVEREARARRAGLWQDGHPVPPWEFRQRPA